jgi:hypothetical protein
VILYFANALGIRGDLKNLATDPRYFLSFGALFIAYVSLFVWASRSRSNTKLVFLFSSFCLLFFTFWEAIINTSYGIAWGGWTPFFRMDLAYFGCFKIGFMTGLVLMSAQIGTQVFLKISPKISFYFLSGTLAAAGGIMVQSLYCPVTSIGHMSTMHLGQALLLLVANFTLQSAWAGLWKFKIKTKIKV